MTGAMANGRRRAWTPIKGHREGLQTGQGQAFGRSMVWEAGPGSIEAYKRAYSLSQGCH